MVLSGSCAVIFLAATEWAIASFSGVPWLASITICCRVCLLRKRVKRGDAAEMKRTTTEVDSEEVNFEDGNKFRRVEREGVELEDGHKFRGVQSEGRRLEDGNKFREGL